MMRQVADGVFVRQSERLQNNSIAVTGNAGLLLVDPGVTREDLAAIVEGVRELGDPVVAGFATHPHWDHVLWDAAFGNGPRWATSRAAATLQGLVATPSWQDRVAGVMPDDIAADVPLERFGLLTALPAEAHEVPWDGPVIRVLEHDGHAAGSAALFLPEQRMLIAGDMLSDLFVPMLNFGSADALGDYLTALDLLEEVAGDVNVVVPGHGTVGDGPELRSRLDLDRAYVLALQAGTEPDDPRINEAARPGTEWVRDIHEGQVRQLASQGE